MLFRKELALRIHYWINLSQIHQNGISIMIGPFCSAELSSHKDISRKEGKDKLFLFLSLPLTHSILL